MSGRGSGRRSGAGGGHRQYPRSVRVNEILREVLAESLERMTDLDERLDLVTITAVSCDPDLRHATVWLASLSEDEAEALGELRIRLQAEISRQVRLKRTPQLTFQADPAIATGGRVEEILRDLDLPDDEPESVGSESVGSESVGSESVGPESVGPESVESAGPEIPSSPVVPPPESSTS